MNSFVKPLLTVILLALLVASAYILFITQTPSTPSKDTADHNDKNAPLISKVSGNLTATAGQSTTITVLFSDDAEVTTAVLFYRPASAIHWSSKSILTGTADISLPLFSNESWYYYVLVDDAAGNGPVGDPSADGSKYYTITVIPSNPETPDGDNNGEEQDDTPDIGRSVFVEIGTKIVCSECPKISLLMKELYRSGDYPFYYVSLPIDNPYAADYLTRYNVWGYPTVYIDGGYEVSVGSNVGRTVLQEKITNAANRIKPKLQIHTQAGWDNTSRQLRVDIVLGNDEQTSYTGELRVYLTEIISTKWQAGTPEHFSFLSFLLLEPIAVSSYGAQTFTATADASGLDPENLMIFTVVSNQEVHVGYSQPPDKNQFKAHYVDAVTATAVVQDGNLPPEVGIENPMVNYVHRRGTPVRKSMLGRTILLGSTTVVAYAYDDSSITKVEFYINDRLTETLLQEPYEWRWHAFSFGKKTITVKAYDDTGKTSSASIDVLVGMKWSGVLSIFSKQ